MPLFQNAVVSKYIKSLNMAEIEPKWELFKSYFHNPEIQENIRNSNEEQLQGGFLRNLFANVLGYTLNPEPKFNLTREHRNVKDSKKADGAIIIDDVVKAVIELKGPDVTDLSKVETQAFGYKNNQINCTYVITSNFEKLRFYIDNAVEHIEFNLFTLTKSEFKLLYLCLAYENIKNDLPSKIKEVSISEEDVITKTLYKDYSEFKRELYQNLVELNPQFDKLTLFSNSQILLDRFLFLFFAEDRHLLPPNSVRLVLSQWKKLKDLDAYTPLINRFRMYFGYLNTGYKGKNYDVFAYNGGLFTPNEVLDTVVIDDDLLYKHALKISDYDFNSEVDVNILGHIFENSLNEIDEVKAEIEGKEVDKSKTKRKRDGVFYTPRYITKYIVENTIGKLCEAKKAELNITDKAYQPAKQRSKRKLDNLNLYRDWLLQLTICDPACGSGAFLNQALDFLIDEHKYIDELSAKYNKDTLVLSDVERSILENNLFGVDLNEESVEIAKLSLWLRTAQPNRKLNDLNDNIKVGNSLIDDPEVAGNKAFNWESEFPHIFEKGGFDVIIGNPPYVQASSEVFKKFLTSKSSDLYAYFFEKGVNILKNQGYLGFITPSSFFTNIGFNSLREFLLKFKIEKLIDLGENVFPDASVDSGITILKNISVSNKDEVLVASHDFNFKPIKQKVFETLQNKMFNVYLNPVHLNICNGIESRSINLEKIAEFSRGVEFGFRSKNVSDKKSDEFLFPIVSGRNILRHSINFQNKYVNYDPENLSIYKPLEIYQNEKILVRRIGSDIISSYDDLGYFNVCDVYNIQLKNEVPFNLKYISAVLNSKLMSFYFDTKFKSVKKLFPKIPIKHLRLLPIIDIDINEQNTFVKLVEIILNKNRKKDELLLKLIDYIKYKYQIEKLPKKLENWAALESSRFLKELNKAIKSTNKQRSKNNLQKVLLLSKKDEIEWLELFKERKQEVKSLEKLINQNEIKIDSMVYELYGLTEEEIAIVENS